jgi:protein deglycase
MDEERRKSELSTMLKTLVLLYPQFSEYELSVPLSILMQGGKPIVTCGITDAPVMGESGLTCLPDVSIEQVDLQEIDSLLLPGCMDIMALHKEEELFKFIQTAGEVVSVIASISSSPYLLARAGLLEGKRFTVGMTKEGRDDSGVFEEDHYIDELVVRDGTIITAKGRGFIDFGAVFGEALGLTFDKAWYNNHKN